MDSVYGMVRFDGHFISPADVCSVERRAQSSYVNPGKGAGNVNDQVWYGRHEMLGFLPSGCRRDDAAQHAPWRHQQSGCVITAQARIDNRVELAAALDNAAEAGADTPDIQLILLAYLRWGRDCLPRLLGSFAFAIWDEPSQLMFCARDPMGTASFAYVHLRNYFAFASNPEWLLGLPGVSARPNALLVAEFLVPALTAPPSRVTWREGVLALLQGEYLVLGPGQRLQVSRWWEPPPVETVSYTSDHEIEEHFRSLFKEAVRCRMSVGEGPTALMMSGGIDSMAIAATMHQLLPSTTRLSTYSGVFDGAAESVETRSILSLVDAFNCDATLISVPSLTGPLSIDDLIEVAWSKPHPVDNSLLVPSMACLAASRRGETAMLHGVSGDIASGVPIFYIARLIQAHRWSLAWSESQAASKNNVYLRGRSPYWMIGRGALGVMLPTELKRWVRLAGWALQGRDRHGLPAETKLLNKDLLHQFQRSEFQKTFTSLSEQIPKDTSSSEMNFAVLASGQSGYGLIGRRFGIKLSDPWADLRLLQFFRNLPIERKVREGWTKYPVRKALSSKAGAAVIWRKDKEHVG